MRTASGVTLLVLYSVLSVPPKLDLFRGFRSIRRKEGELTHLSARARLKARALPTLSHVYPHKILTHFTDEGEVQSVIFPRACNSKLEAFLTPEPHAFHCTPRSPCSSLTSYTSRHDTWATAKVKKF